MGDLILTPRSQQIVDPRSLVQGVSNRLRPGVRAKLEEWARMVEDRCGERAREDMAIYQWSSYGRPEHRRNAGRGSLTYADSFRAGPVVEKEPLDIRVSVVSDHPAARWVERGTSPHGLNPRSFWPDREAAEAGDTVEPRRFESGTTGFWAVEARKLVGPAGRFNKPPIHPGTPRYRVMELALRDVARRVR